MKYVSIAHPNVINKWIVLIAPLIRVIDDKEDILIVELGKAKYWLNTISAPRDKIKIYSESMHETEEEACRFVFKQIFLDWDFSK